MKKSVSVLLIAMLILACSKDEVSNEYVPIKLDLKSQSLVEASNQFGFDLFKQTVKGEKSNLMISPLSVSQALGMTWNGAVGTTQDEITTTLGFDIDNDQQLNASNKTIRQALLGADRKVDMNIANSIWYRKGYDVKQEFIDVNNEFYNSEVEALDFSQGDKSKQIINDWVSDETKGRIPEIVEEVNSSYVMFLINAVYFKGKWKYQFEKESTSKELFYNEQGGSVEVAMMKQEADLSYFESDLCRGVSMPYGNGHFEMIVLLPGENVELSTLIDDLSDQSWQYYLNTMSTRGVALYLPKFTFESKKELNNPLMQLGMKKAFSAEADLSGIGPGDLYISKVQHNTFIEVNEEGSEAAAATSVEIRETSVGGGSPMEFRVDRPFVFAIREKDTGCIMFMGQVYNPVN